MTKQIINIGSAPNDGTGDELRVAMDKINQNFSEVYQLIAGEEWGGITPLEGNIIISPGSAGSLIVNANTSADAMRITQIGTGNALLIEDSANPDTTPFVITSSGNVGIGILPTDKLHVSGNIIAVGDVTANTITSLTGDGTPPFRVASTTLVDNLTSQYATSVVSGTSNIKVVADHVLVSAGGAANVMLVSPTGANIAGTANITGNVNVGNLGTTGTISTTSITSGTSNIRLVNNANVAISVGGTSNVLVLQTTGLTATGFLTVTGNVNVPNIGVSGTIVSGTVSNGTSNLRIASGANVTISAAGNSNVFTVSGTGITSANIFTGNIVNGTSNIVVTNNGNVNVSVGGTANVLTVTSTGITVSNITGNIVNGTSNIKVTNNGNVNVSVGGVANVLTVTSTGANIAGTANITGNTIVKSLQPIAGTNSVAPIYLTSGTNLTNAVAGAFEYDGTLLYATGETTAGRGLLNTAQTFRLNANGANITTISNFFGSGSNVALTAGGTYVFEYLLLFTKITSQETVTFTLGFSNAPVSVSAFGVLTPTSGSAVGAAESVANIAGAANITLVTGSLIASQNHAMKLTATIDANVSTGGTFSFQATSANGLTPLRGSYFRYQRVPATSVGTFS